MLTPIAQSHLAALEAELARVTAQRDALRHALDAILRDTESRQWLTTGQICDARTALQSCQD